VTLNPDTSSDMNKRLNNSIVDTAGFPRVMENLESHGILKFYFPGLEKSWKFIKSQKVMEKSWNFG
jgi:hypothetical protein